MRTSNFQIIVLGVCTALLLVGVGLFASFGGLFGAKSIGKIVIWGTVDSDAMQILLDNLKNGDKSIQDVSYVEKDPRTYNDDLINAMAKGTAPDLFLLDDGSLSTFSDKIITIPYGAVSQATYLNSYIDEGQLFLTSQGALALPFAVDPLVMYWNRDLFASAGLATAPQYWNDFLSLSPKITSLDANAQIKKSAVALGQWQNISQAKEILATLFMQAGDQIAARGQDGQPVVLLGTTPNGFPANPAESALRFYTEFTNPSKTSYAWNKALPQDVKAFEAGDLAVYFGYASEYGSIAAINPNLHFSVSVMPQIQGNSTRLAYGHLTALAIPRTSRNAQNSLIVAQKLTSQAASGLISKALALPSARRDVTADTSSSAAAAVFLQSALIARAWLDPNPTASDTVFKGMIESVVSGKSQPAQAVSDGGQQLLRLF